MLMNDLTSLFCSLSFLNQICFLVLSSAKKSTFLKGFSYKILFLPSVLGANCISDSFLPVLALGCIFLKGERENTCCSVCTVPQTQHFFPPQYTIHLQCLVVCESFFIYTSASGTMLIVSVLCLCRTNH